MDGGAAPENGRISMTSRPRSGQEDSMPPDDATRIRETAGDPGVGLKANSPEAMVGRELKGAFRIEGKIGEGGMGVVFRAPQLNLGRPVAVKVIHVGSRIPASAVDRFFR